MTLASAVVRDQHLIRPRPILPTGADQRRTAASTSIPTVTVTAGNPAHDDGAWTQVVASTAIESEGCWLRRFGTGQSGVNTSMLLDIYIGDGSQNPVAPLIDDFQVGYSLEVLNQVSVFGLWLPLHIPQGVEVIARCRSATASRTITLSLDLYGNGPTPPFRNCTTYGATPASSSGTLLTAPAGNNAKGAWTEISSAVTNPIYGLGLGIGAGTGTVTAGTVFIDIGAGAAGSERVIVPDVFVQYFNTEIIGNDTPPGRFAPLTQPLGVGERLAARFQGSSLSVPVDLILYGYS